MPVPSLQWFQRIGLGCLVAAATAFPARAIEEVLIELPLLDSSFSVRVSELKSPQALMAGRSDLAELDRASNGAVSQVLLQLLQRPIPMSLNRLADGSVGSPLLEQALLVVSSLGTIEGRSPDLSGQTFRAALHQAMAHSKTGDPTLVELIEALPGRRVRFNLGQVRTILGRMLAQRTQANRLFAEASPAVLPVAPVPATQVLPTRQRQARLSVRHRSSPLEVVLLQPAQGGNGRLVLISHGLWDSPKNFVSWATLLASRGYTVALPRHPGSDNREQMKMLTGAVPPPKPVELALRFRDLSAVTDAVQNGQLAGVSGVNADAVVVIGHSWGATTALQQAGLVPQSATLKSRCPQLDDPQRNLSWTLQCSWLEGVKQAALQDQRVVAAVAISPPMSLLSHCRNCRPPVPACSWSVAPMTGWCRPILRRSTPCVGPFPLVTSSSWRRAVTTSICAPVARATAVFSVRCCWPGSRRPMARGTHFRRVKAPSRSWRLALGAMPRSR